ncbi:MAG TPA: MaoC family dehydratase [Burkholderiaceae bacterium]
MSEATVYAKRPSAAAFMPRALWPGNAWSRRQAFPAFRLTWKGYTVRRDDIDRLLALVGVAPRSPGDGVSMLAPHVTGFRLLMVMLTHPRWPIPIWRALQVRNRLLLHRPIEMGEAFDLVTRVSGWRVLDKGAEVDLHTRLQREEETRWESVVTFYYRGRFGPPQEHGEALGTPPAAPKIDERSEPVATWAVDAVGKWAFGQLTGDYNPLHQWDWYARRVGFRSATAHPQRVAASCLSHLSASGAGVRGLDLWIKGPVYFGGDVVLRRVQTDSGESTDFGAWTNDDDRPALVGRLTGSQEGWRAPPGVEKSTSSTVAVPLARPG